MGPGSGIHLDKMLELNTKGKEGNAFLHRGVAGMVYVIACSCEVNELGPGGGWGAPEWVRGSGLEAAEAV